MKRVVLMKMEILSYPGTSIQEVVQKVLLLLINCLRIWKEKRMTKSNESDTIARLALGLIIFLVMRYAPRLLEWWNKRNRQEGT